MNVKELKALLKDIPDDTEVWFKDMNFGGGERIFDTNDLTWEPTIKCLLVNSLFWEPVD